MTHTTQHGYPFTATRAQFPLVPARIHPGSVQAGNSYRVFGGDTTRARAEAVGVRRSNGVSGLTGLLPVDPSVTRDVRRGYSPARTNRGIGPSSLNPSLRGLAGLASAQSAQLISSGIYTGLSTAAIYDPEPISKTILAIGASLVGLFSKVFAGCGNSCIAATKVVDQVESEYLKPLLANWQALPVKYESNRAAALAVFDQAWSLVLQGCSDPALGDAGKRCISERQRGGSSAWCPSCNWFTLYRDPIANDTSVLPDPVPSTISTTNTGGSSSLSNQASTSNGTLITTNSNGSIDLNSTVGGLPVWALALGAIVLLAGSTK